LYGTTVYGNANDDGTVFSITPSGRETVLYGFKGSGDGERPYAGVINVKGTLYGTTHLGGANGNGAVFSVTPSGTETVLYSFKGGSGDGEFPYAGLINVKGMLYGMTIEGGANGVGTIFSITPSRTETVLHSFGGSGDGQYPYYGALLYAEGKLYGTTFYGGAYGNGNVFRLSP
ncbi:MAG: choice-of-anchor tandem repeat GloVer-containing protein, partial [Candidatus Cybelea sp.]